MPINGSLFFQDRASPLIEQLVYFHDLIIIVLSLVTVLVGFSILFVCRIKNRVRKLVQDQEIEIVWTIFPVFLLFIIGFPSLQVLYIIDDPFNIRLRIKVVGHQWFWSYEFSDFSGVEYESYIIGLDRDKLISRLLDVDNSVVLPIGVDIRVLIGAYDVIHAWTVPALGLKCDCVPGRLNQIVFNINRVGIFFGQCSEVCGANHRFIPIKVESVPTNVFVKWISSFISLTGGR